MADPPTKNVWEEIEELLNDMDQTLMRVRDRLQQEQEQLRDR